MRLEPDRCRSQVLNRPITKGHGRCTRRPAQTVTRSAKFPSNPAETERESRGGRWRTGAEREWRRTNLREVESVVTTTRRGATRRPADAVSRRGMLRRVAAARLGPPPRPSEPEVMHTLIDQTIAPAAPGAVARKPKRSRRRPRPASEHPYLPLELPALVEIGSREYAG